MKILVLSDVHGNLPALENVINKEQDCDLIISLGDVVNYGPWSNECVDLLESLPNKVLLVGNHEKAFIEGKYDGESKIVIEFFNFCLPRFSRFAEISRYVESYKLFDFDFIHTLNEQYIFPNTEINLKKNTFIGHSHRSFIKKMNGFTLVNVGSVGQNRARIDESNYVVWEPEKSKITEKTIPMDVDVLLNKMKALGYPDICMNYIKTKQSAK